MSDATTNRRPTAAASIAAIAVWLCSMFEPAAADTAIRVVGVREQSSETAAATDSGGPPPAVDVKPIFAASKPQAQPRTVVSRSKIQQATKTQQASPKRQTARRTPKLASLTDNRPMQLAVKPAGDVALESGVFITLAAPIDEAKPLATEQESVVAAAMAMPEPPSFDKTPARQVSAKQSPDDAIPAPSVPADAPPGQSEYVPAPATAPYACSNPGCPNCPGQSGASTICGVYCSDCRAACNATWDDVRRIPWSIFSQGEYVGPARREHVFQYFIRVDDQIDLVYMQDREKMSAPYVIGIGDQLRVESVLDETLDRQVIVQPDGTVTLPQVGELVAAGKTIADLRNEINEAYEQTGVRPPITVTPLVTNVPLQDVLDAVDARGGAGGQTQAVRVTPEGTIQAPGIGSIYVQGLTIEELRRELEARYNATYGPGLRITPLLTQRAPSYVFVGGEVASPGRYTLEGPTTVMQAIALAGGWNVGGNTNQIVVFRRDENWCLKATKIDLFKPLYGKDPCPVNDVWLRDNDFVLVPKRPIKVVDDIIELYMTRGVYSAFPINFVYNFSQGSTVIPIGIGP